jgi:hypothetical protein
MTRRLLTLLSIACAIALLTIALTAPVRLEGAALVPPKASRPAAIHGIEVHLGDGIFQLRLRTCEGCAPALTFEIRLPQIHIDWFLPS